MTTKIAVPVAIDGTIFQHFGKTETFKLYTVVDGVVGIPEIVDAESEGSELLVIWLIQNGIKSVICGNIGPGALGMLTAAGIKAYAGVDGDADEAVEDFLADRLAAATTPTCADHDCSGGCSHCSHHCH